MIEDLNYFKTFTLNFFTLYLNNSKFVRDIQIDIYITIVCWGGSHRVKVPIRIRQPPIFFFNCDNPQLSNKTSLINTIQSNSSSINHIINQIRKEIRHNQSNSERNQTPSTTQAMKYTCRIQSLTKWKEISWRAEADSLACWRWHGRD